MDRKTFLACSAQTPFAAVPAPTRSAGGDVGRLCELVNQHAGDEAARRDGDVVHFRHTRNPEGMKVSDGWCLCPAVERGPEGLSATYCECSVGYVGELLEWVVGAPVRVELLESIKRGGSGCRFLVHLPASARES